MTSDRLIPDGEHDDFTGERVADLPGAHVARELLGQRVGLRRSVPSSVTPWPPSSARVAMPRAMLPVPMIVMFMVAPAFGRVSDTMARGDRGPEWHHLPMMDFPVEP